MYFFVFSVIVSFKINLQLFWPLSEVRGETAGTGFGEISRYVWYSPTTRSRNQ